MYAPGTAQQAVRCGWQGHDSGAHEPRSARADCPMLTDFTLWVLSDVMTVEHSDLQSNRLDRIGSFCRQNTGTGQIRCSTAGYGYPTSPVKKPRFTMT